MGTVRARIVVVLLVCGALAALADSAIPQPVFDLVSGVEWAERAAKAPLGEAASSSRPVTPLAIASGLILLAGGLIVTVTVFGLHTRARFVPARVRAG